MAKRHVEDILDKLLRIKKSDKIKIKLGINQEKMSSFHLELSNYCFPRVHLSEIKFYYIPSY